MSLGELSGVPRDGVDDVSGEVICWHLTSFLIHDVKIVSVHNFLEAVERFCVNLAQFFERSVVRHEREFAATEIGRKMFHAPDGSLHLKQERGVIAFVFLQFSACIGNYAMFAVRVNLGQNSFEAAGFLSSPRLASTIRA